MPNKSRKKSIDPVIKSLLGFSESKSDDDVFSWWKKVSTGYCKPCWELKYCPYGKIVEDFPLMPPTREEAMSQNEYLRECLQRGILQDGRLIDDTQKTLFQQQLDSFHQEDYPIKIPQYIKDMECNIFGHICPIVFSGEEITETTTTRRRGRYIPFTTQMRVVRRDNHTCQICGKHLLDQEVEFDHIIPIVKGGSSEEHNIRLTCSNCNRKKSNKIHI